MRLNRAQRRKARSGQKKNTRATNQRGRSVTQCVRLLIVDGYPVIDARPQRGLNSRIWTMELNRPTTSSRAVVG